MAALKDEKGTVYVALINAELSRELSLSVFCLFVGHNYYLGLLRRNSTLMQAPLKEKNDIKIFILYLMRNVGYPLDFPNINDIVVQDGLVNYFDFAECFAELLDTGNIAEIKTDGQPSLYNITEQGRAVADSLQSDLMMMIREKSLRSALRLLSFKKRGSQVKYRFSEREGGGYDFHCKIIEAKAEIMTLTFFVENKKLLDRIIYNFDNKPETVYRGMLAVLSGEINYLID